jgi:predicted F0F1-ATPase subunit
MNTTINAKKFKPVHTDRTNHPNLTERKPEHKPNPDWPEASSLHWKYGGEMHVWRFVRSTGVMGLVLAVPTILGMATGMWIDTLWPGSRSWFSILAPVGFALGCVCAIFWSYVTQEQQQD